MEDAIRQRMRKALEMKGLRHYAVCLECGLNRNYLWESWTRNKGTFEGYKKIADRVGISWEWLVNDSGGPFVPPRPNPNFERGALVAAFEALLGHFLHLDEAQTRACAELLLDIATDPPDDNFAIDISSRIRIGILALLRQYEAR